MVAMVYAKWCLGFPNTLWRSVHILPTVIFLQWRSRLSASKHAFVHGPAHRIWIHAPEILRFYSKNILWLFSLHPLGPRTSFTYTSNNIDILLYGIRSGVNTLCLRLLNDKPNFLNEINGPPVVVATCSVIIHVSELVEVRCKRRH